MNNKIRTIAAFWAAYISMARSQPITCTEDFQCDKGFYCDNGHCGECIRCDDLKREAPRWPIACVTSVIQCGPCIDGLVMDGSIDQRACVLPTTQADSGLPVYIWVIIGVGITLVLLLIAFFLLLVLRRKNIMYYLKICSTTSVPPRQAVIPSAPENSEMSQPPPAYTELDNMASNHRTASPDPAHTQTQLLEEDGARPLMKLSMDDAYSPTRQASRHLDARPFNYPTYHPYSTASEESDPGSPFTPHDETTQESLWSPHEPSDNNNTIAVVVKEFQPESPDPQDDEDTRESFWTPNQPSSNNNTFAGSINRYTVKEDSGSEDESDDEGPPAKAICQRPDTTVSGVANPRVEVSHGLNSRAANPHGASSHGTNPHGANSHGANSNETNPHGSNLRGENSHGTNSHGASSHRNNSHRTNTHGASSQGNNSHDANSRGPGSQNVFIINNNIYN